jgi:hypothetical protein
LKVSSYLLLRIFVYHKLIGLLRIIQVSYSLGRCNVEGAYQV